MPPDRSLPSRRSSSGIGERLRTIREARELSLSALAQASGMSKAYLVRIETGRPKPVNLTLETVDRLASALGISAAWLAYGRGEPEDRVMLLAKILNAEPDLRIDYVKALKEAHRAD